jgi:HEXXH motif-containing protein
MVPVTDGLVQLPSLGTAEIQQPAARVSVSATQVGEVTIGGKGWRPLRRVLVAGALVALDNSKIDDLPVAGFEGDWTSGLQGAGEVLRRRHWTVAREMRELIRAVVPLPGDRQRSATVPEAFGCVAMTRPRDATGCASILAHELQHTKLAAVHQHIPLVKKGAPEHYYVPWRTDPRPVLGLLHGIYAHLGVAGFWRRERFEEQGLAGHVQFARWRDSALETCDLLLETDYLTEEGRLFVQAMRRTLVSWLDDEVPVSALRQAREQARTHRARWAR